MNAAELPILSIMLAVPMIGALACLFVRAEVTIRRVRSGSLSKALRYSVRSAGNWV